MCCCSSLQLVLVCIVCCVFTYIVCFVLIVCFVILCASMQLVFLRPPCLLVSLWCILYVLCDLYWFCALLYCVLTCNLCSWDLLVCLYPCGVFHIFCVLCTGCVLCYIVCLSATCALETCLLACACACLLVCCISCTTHPALDRAFRSVSLISSSFYNFISFFSYDYLL